MITGFLTFQIPGGPVRNLGTFSGRSMRDIVRQVCDKWPLLPPDCLRLDGRPLTVPKLPGFRDPATQHKAATRLRDPEVQRRKVATRLATEAVRRAREAALTPAEREQLYRERSNRHKERWRKYYQEKAQEKAKARKAVI